MFWMDSNTTPGFCFTLRQRDAGIFTRVFSPLTHLKGREGQEFMEGYLLQEGFTIIKARVSPSERPEEQLLALSFCRGSSLLISC